jgi:hypothetical protein
MARCLASSALIKTADRGSEAGTEANIVKNNKKTEKIFFIITRPLSKTDTPFLHILHNKSIPWLLLFFNKV